MPPELRDTGGMRAIELLRELASTSPTASVQLRQGEVIGQGGMGIVRTAEQVALGRVVAVKTLRPERRDPVAALDLLREAWVTGTVEHPNVPPVHYLGVEPDGSPLIVLKRIEGVEWSQLVADPAEVARRFGAKDLLAWNLGILMQVLNALRFAHHRGVIHRDLKPSNVMIGDFGEVYLLDWGIAVSLEPDPSGRLPTARDELAGTPCYMAPEMLGRESGPPLSERTDVYLAGAVLFELVTGEPPHTGSSAIEVLASVIESRPTLPPTVPAELARICMRAMHVDPDQRFESVEALRLALQGYLEHRGSAELAARAQERLDELLAALAASHVDHEEIARLFGACRFGFHEALAVWRDNSEARAGLARATIAVAEHELATGNPDTAVALLTELDEPPPLLARARAAAAARHRREADVNALLAQHDTTIGRRTRSTLVAFFGGLVTVIPFLVWLVPGRLPAVSNEILIAWPCAAVVAILFAIWWARDTLSATLLNRRFSAVAVFLFAAEAILAFGAQVVGLDPIQTQTFTLVGWGIAGGAVAITMDPWFAPGASAYLIAFMIASRWPHEMWLATSLANLAFTVNVVIRWRPSTFKMTDAERAWLDDRARSRRGARAGRRRPAAGEPAPPSTGGSG